MPQRAGKSGCLAVLVGGERSPPYWRAVWSPWHVSRDPENRDKCYRQLLTSWATYLGFFGHSVFLILLLHRTLTTCAIKNIICICSLKWTDKMVGSWHRHFRCRRAVPSAIWPPLWSPYSGPARTPALRRAHPGSPKTTSVQHTYQTEWTPAEPCRQGSVVGPVPLVLI